MRTPSTLPRRWNGGVRAVVVAAGLAWVVLVPLAPAHAPARLPGIPLTTFLTRTERATPDSAGHPEGEPAERAQVLERLGARAWHAAGHRGRGLKVAVLDSGFSGYRAHLGKALPAQVTARSFRLDGNLEARDSEHGILCAEVIHVLAPEAELLLANWEPDRPEQFLEAVRWARGQGAKVLSCSVIMPTWSDGEGHGAVHQALARLLGDGSAGGDGLCFASAGNTAQRHWSGLFRDGGAGWHEWKPGERENVVQPWGGERVSVELCWQGSARYELAVQDVTAGREAGRGGTSESGPYRWSVVRFQPEANHAYTLRLRLRSGDKGAFHLVVLGGGLEYATAQGSIGFPGDGPEVIAVGAVDPRGRRLAYSSCGPNSAEPKPDFVATVPFPSSWRTRPFAGTSAAAPQAAGLAALVWARHPDWTARQVREALRRGAEDLGPAGHDCETGFGRVRLPGAEGSGR
jgi:subtilisin family serine protease